MSAPVRTSPRTAMIKGLTPSLPERGKIKIGAKGESRTSKAGKEFQPPVKLDHFVVTTLDRGRDGNFLKDKAIHALIGDTPKDIPVRLLYDDPTLNFPTRYAAYKGRSLWCTGDGEEARRLADDGQSYSAVACPCGRQAPTYQGPDKCKMNGSLSVLIEGVGGLGGVHKFRTTSYNSIVGLLSTQAFLKSVTGGPLGNIPLTLTLRPKQASAPDGSQLTIYVVGLEFAGDVADAQRIGHQIALDRAQTNISIAQIEDEARRLLTAPADVPLPGDDNDDIMDEFYPEQAAPPRPTLADFTSPTPEPAADFVDNETGEIVPEAQTEQSGQSGQSEAAPAADIPPDTRAQARFWASDSHLIALPGVAAGAPDWKVWCGHVAAAIQDARTRAELLKLQDDNEAHFNQLHIARPTWFASLMKRFVTRIGEFT